MNNGIAIFKQEAIAINKEFPDLQYSEGENGIPLVTGTLKLIDPKGTLLDNYEIRICPTDHYPLRFPHVFEVGNRLPANIDWHVFLDGHCCIKSIPEEILICRNGITLASFIKNEVIPYFFNQKFRELNGYFLNERSHGTQGNIEFFEDVFKTTSYTEIAKGLIYISQRKEPSRVSECFCGSGNKYRKCHREALRILSQFTNEELDYYFKIIISSPRYLTV
ncbi:SEC-C metal-binding domain-containing protein [Chitinophaga ginsengisegetis]|uniref:SEC-C metal-binding domain-containing protein n=1 Tax=Chitinophaga ginsengisegetis TaxID=393003 RepID=UPI000DB99A83|nr:SEC-C metal-binding domain-containing protein [Chitinophaga ginsengisegetis]MDR6571352.1 hypothetical protein [Chitinophaga ginsengisegetis]MDR6651079.1 hypothetical protein [Chitinophaga ginsengisegetis]MDR6657429.1 hypothetical protein [Chitinophaga ginsengisegetis]